jgi:DnaA family protein
MGALEQIPLDMQLAQENTFANFIGGDNGALIQALTAPADEQHWCVYVWGSHGAGRTHLLQAACHLAHTENLQTAYVPLDLMRDYSPDMLENLELANVVTLDNIEAVLHDAAWQEALFHLYNRVHSAGHKLIISAHQAAKQVDCSLADLQSRLSAANHYQVQALNDQAKKQLLQQRATENGLAIEEEVAEFLIRRCPRNVADLLATMDTLDRASLVAKRRLTIPFVKQVLGM